MYLILSCDDFLFCCHGKVNRMLLIFALDDFHLEDVYPAVEGHDVLPPV